MNKCSNMIWDGMTMDLFDKLRILAASAKYDASCASSGVERSSSTGFRIGNAAACGLCHSFAADGRCVSLLKVLMSNACVYDCQYCVNRISNDVPRATFTPKELAELTIHFYKRNYIEGLFLSSGVIKNPDYTCERLIETLRLLREEYGFGGYIHAKAIPGADNALLARLGQLADRMSVNIELPSQKSLQLLAPNKSKTDILRPMGLIRSHIEENTADLVRYRHAPKFAPAGQSTQMIIGATPETDYTILNLSAALYQKYGLRRVYYSAYMPVSNNPLLPALGTSRCCASTGSIRRIGCYVFMAFPPGSCWMKSIPILTLMWIPNATGRSTTWSCSLWRSTARRRRCCCVCQASA